MRPQPAIHTKLYGVKHMNLKRLFFGLGIVALGVASAASYEVTITSPTWAGATQLKPGVYKLAVTGHQCGISPPARRWLRRR